MKKIELLLALLLAGGGAFGQEAQGDMPADVFYLLPEFRPGMVYFSDQGPAQGQLNICAVDQTLRFMDKGQELSSNADNINRVVVDDIVFVRVDGAFYRLYPINDELTVAYRRDVEILRDVKTGAYGIQSRTSSIREVGSLQSDGMMYTLQSSKSYPYNVSETCFLYQAGDVTPITKRSLRKRFPARKDDLDAWLKSHSVPKSLDDTRAFLSRLIAGEEL
ncbi:MAG: hypothetical protein J6P75_02960 [Bacteroidales bacterium]|nr:hypothetical protein [Bacteroidales bacterium]